MTTQPDVERIFRDVMTTRGINVSLLRTEHRPGIWRLTLRGAAGHLWSVEFTDSSPAAVRAALDRWTDSI